MKKGEIIIYIGEDRSHIKKGEKVKLKSFWSLPFREEVFLGVKKQLKDNTEQIRSFISQKSFRSLSHYLIKSKELYMITNQHTHSKYFYKKLVMEKSFYRIILVL